MRFSRRHLDEPRMATGRRELLKGAGAGTLFGVLGGLYVLLDDCVTREARAQARPDGKARLPPGQRVIAKLKPMGGQEGDASPSRFRLKVYGEVDQPFTVDFKGLLALPQVTLESDVHCVTGWSVLGAKWTGVRLGELAKRAKLKKSARYVIFEAAHGYTANVPLSDALKPNVMVAHRLDGKRLARDHGTPVRAVVPDLYFWKSAKWLTAIRFSNSNAPGYWERRGYHDHGDPWKEERYG